MSVVNGQKANQTTFNNAFISKTDDSGTVGIIALNHPSSGGTIANAQQAINTTVSDLATHEGDTSNPHAVTQSQVGLDQVDNTSDLDKPISTATQDALDLKADLVAGKVPAAQLPSYVDDVEEYANLAGFPVTGEQGKIYVAIDTGKVYRWSGSIYVEISAEDALVAHLSDASDAHDASAISSIPSGNLASDNVQDALDELQSDIDTRSLGSDLTDHINDPTASHAASAISIEDLNGYYAGDDVESFITETGTWLVAVEEIAVSAQTDATNAQNTINGHTSTSSAHYAVAIVYEGNGMAAFGGAIDVEAALDFIANNFATTTFVNDHINDTTDAHDATAISVTDGGVGLPVNAQLAFIETWEWVIEVEVKADAAQADADTAQGTIDYHMSGSSAHIASAIIYENITPTAYGGATDVEASLDYIAAWQRSGNTASRPGSPATGQTYFDTTLGIPIWYSGANWVDATGTTV